MPHETRLLLLIHAVRAIAFSSVLGSAIFTAIGCYNTCDKISNPIQQMLGFYIFSIVLSMAVGYTLALLYVFIAIKLMNRTGNNGVSEIIFCGTLPVVLIALLTSFEAANEYRIQFILGSLVYCGAATASFVFHTRKHYGRH